MPPECRALSRRLSLVSLISPPYGRVMKLVIAVPGIVALTACLSSAELDFKKEHLKLTPKPDAARATATYEFTYTGEHPITIQEVDADCGCISAQADKDVYVKGDEGRIDFVFGFARKEGKQTNRISVVYTEKIAEEEKAPPQERLGPSGEDPNTTVAPKTKVLSVEIDIPVVVNVEPKMTTWMAGSKPAPREIKVTMKHLAPVRIKEVTSSRNDFKVETREVKPGESYIITLTPGSTEKKQLGMLTIVTDCSVPRHQKKLAFFQVASPEPNQPGDAGEHPIIPPSFPGLRSQ